MECLESGLDKFLKHNIQTYVANSHTVTYKTIAPTDNPTEFEFNCSGHSDYYIHWNSVRLLLRIEHVKTDGSHIKSSKSNTVRCLFNLIHPIFSSLILSLNGKTVTFHEKNYHYNAYIQELRNYCSDALTHLVSNLLYVISSGEFKNNSGHAKWIHYLWKGNTLALYGRIHADLFSSIKC